MTTLLRYALSEPIPGDRPLETNSPQRPSRLAALTAGLLVALPAWAIIAAGLVRGRGAHDQLNYHEQVVRRFAEQLPALDLSNYLSATTPGYHAILALVARTLTDDRRALQLAGSLFGVGLCALLAWSLSKRVGARTAVVLSLPVVCSMPIVYATAWMLPDNAGWIGVLGVLLLALDARLRPRALVAGSFLLAALVCFRQIHIWAAGCLWASAWLGPRAGNDDRPGTTVGEVRAITTDPITRGARTLVAVLASLPAALALAWFARLWGGLTPPMFHERHEGGNWAAPAFVLALFGCFGCFLLPWFASGARALLRERGVMPACLLALGAALALVAPTSYSVEGGRYSGLWEAVRRLPAPGERSVLIALLAPLGAGVVGSMLLSVGRRDRWVLLAALTGFVAAQVVSFKLWQRYNEPFVLMVLALAAGRAGLGGCEGGRGSGVWRARARLSGPVALALGLAMYTGATIAAGRAVRPRELLAPWETQAPVLPGMVGPAGASENGVAIPPESGGVQHPSPEPAD